MVDRFFFNKETVYFALLLIVSIVFLLLFGNILLPVLISIIIAFLLDELVQAFESLNLPRWVALTFSFVVFFGLYLGVFIILPSVGAQINSLIQSLPNIVLSFQSTLYNFSDSYPEVISEEEIKSLLLNLGSQLNNLLSVGLLQLAGTISFAFNALLYAILIPLMVFFFVKDKNYLLLILFSILPRKSELMDSIFKEMNLQLSNYVSGKLVEILIVGSLSYIIFAYIGLPYAVLLSLLVGLSVIIPLFGAILVTIPVLLVGLYEWGLTEQFYWLVGLYILIQILDGNILVPILFSDRNNLHPVFIIIAILFFGGIWGFWGLFFAIPLATFIKAIANSWPQNRHEELE